MISEVDARRIRIGKFYMQHKDKWKKFTVDHFKPENIPARTIYNIIKRVDQNVSFERKPGQGRKISPKTQKLQRGVKRLVANKLNRSQNFIARKYGVHKKTVFRVLKELGLKKFKRIKAPKFDPQ